jgi:hypothetical protein
MEKSNVKLISSLWRKPKTKLSHNLKFDANTLTPTLPEEDTKGHNRVIRKGRKNTAREPWVWSYHTQGGIQKNLQKSTWAFNRGWNSKKPINFGSKLSFISCLSFFLSASTAATYIFTAPTCTTTTINLDPCALNDEFQHFILRFNEMSLLCGIPLERGDRGGWKEAQRQGYFTDNSVH